ncbi:MAG: class I SAM-dependent methyltransferase [Acidimicrobiales bacterium]
MSPFASIRGADVVAIDAEPSMLEVAHLRVPAARVCLAALPDPPFSSKYFDSAVRTFVINHVGDPAAALAELKRGVSGCWPKRLA